MGRIRTYTELVKLPTFRERLEYLKLNAEIGIKTFGENRWINQQFYSSKEWKDFRHEIIARDLGRDLGVEGRDIHGSIFIHHINPLILDDVISHADSLLDPNNVICVSDATHRMIHYGIHKEQIVSERTSGDTKLW